MTLKQTYVFGFVAISFFGLILATEAWLIQNGLPKLSKDISEVIMMSLLFSSLIMRGGK